MEIRAFAERVLLAESLDEKLRRADSDFTDENPGESNRPELPGRPANLRFAPRRHAPPMPKPGAFADPAKRAVAHHIMANHELQACEVMAFILLAFPEAPGEFRMGLAKIIDDEQRHTRMHMQRAADLGTAFGELPVNCYIWKKALDYTCLLDYLAGLPLTFEGRNLDHTVEFADLFESAGDEKSAAVMRVIHREEIEHVRFGWEWLCRLKPPDQSEWDAYCEHLHWPLRPAKAKGEFFQRSARKAAGMTENFLDCLEHAEIDVAD
jgi:uncharacterized ferritin-like protein (DUF455 family)